MGRGGRGQMAGQMSGTTGGMLSGILSGVIWGAVVGALVLLLAALVLDLDRGPDVPGPEAVAGGGVAVPADARGAIGAAPVLLARIDGLLPPGDGPDLPVTLPDPRRSLVPRPAQPELPRLVIGAAVPVPDANIPQVPTASVPLIRVERPGIPAMPGDVSAPTVIQPVPVPPVGTVPARPAAAAPAQPVPPQLAAPSPLIAAPSPPRIGAPPGIASPTVVLPRPTDAVPLRDAAAPLGDVTAPGRPPAPPAPLAPGPQVAFILDGATDAPMPDWLRAGAMPGDGATLRLDRGGAVFAGGDAVAGYLAARAAGTPALLIYARLDGAEDVVFDRIALRARRDGAVAVLVAPDPSLWDRIGAWLDGPARDLVPVAAAALLD